LQKRDLVLQTLIFLLPLDPEAEGAHAILHQPTKTKLMITSFLLRWILTFFLSC
jgi:hypothetical protein